MNDFVWDEKTQIVEKIDGSLIELFCYDGNWHINTRGSFGDGELNFSGKTWGEWVWSLLVREVVEQLDPSWTYVFEFVSPYNKVVKHYPVPQLYLLSVVRNTDGVELSSVEADRIASDLGVSRPKTYALGSPDDILDFLRENGRNDPTFEGFVAVDRDNRRVKMKSESYVHLHHLFDNGNVFNPRRLVPLILNGETDEIVAYLPELKPHIEKIAEQLDRELAALTETWVANWQIADQKEFALAVKDKPFSGLLFQIRKQHGANQNVTHIKQAWRTAEGQILKTLKF